MSEEHRFCASGWTVTLSRREGDYDDTGRLMGDFHERGELVSMLDPAVAASSVYELSAMAEDGRHWQRLLAASGGATGPHRHSALILGGRVFVVLGGSCACLRLEDDVAQWTREVDSVTAFGLHATSKGDGLVVHGELAISRWTLDGERVWERHGRDIFTGELSVSAEGIRVVDFEGNAYCFPE